MFTSKHRHSNYNGLPETFGVKFGNAEFDAVPLVEVIEHLQNSRHIFRQIKSLLKRERVVLLTTPNASRLYSRIRFSLLHKWPCLQTALTLLAMGISLHKDDS